MTSADTFFNSTQHDFYSNNVSLGDNITDQNYIVTTEDKVIFAAFEILGILGFMANIIFVYFLIKFKHYTKPSFVLIISQAIADVWHNFHTSVYFYPAIVTRVNLFTLKGSMFMNAMDWAAWGITLTHMVGLSIDRLVAICFGSFYMRLYIFFYIKIMAISVKFINLIRLQILMSYLIQFLKV